MNRLTLLLLALCLGINAQNNKIIASEGWDEESATEVWTENDVTWSIDWVEEFTDGSRGRTTFTASDKRKLTVLTDWAVLGGYGYQVLTETPEVSVVSSNQKSMVNTAGVRFQWVREKRKITTRGSYKRVVIDDTFTSHFPTEEQTNEWVAVDPFDCVVTYKGKSYTFPRKEINVSHKIMDHSYNTLFDMKNDELLYSVGDNTISAVAFGVLHCSVQFFPAEWGFLYDVKQTVSNNKNHNGFVYVWSLHFSEGYVMPVLVASGSINPDWHFEYCEKTDETAYNSAYYHKDSNEWLNAIASDGSGGMYWSRGGAIVNSKDDEAARNCNWDEGHGTSVHTNRYEITFPYLGRINAIDTYTDRNMGSWAGIVESDVDQHVNFALSFYFDSPGGKIIYDGQEINSFKTFNIESDGPKPMTIQIVPDEGYVLESVTRDNHDATHYVVDNVLSFSSLTYDTSLRFSFVPGEATPPEDPDPDEPQEPEEYVEYNDGTLTFYYDDQRRNREGKTYDLTDSKLSVDGYRVPIWFNHSNSVTRAVFDASFANSRPTNTTSWFYEFKKLQEIEGISNLNTSEVTDMSRMFYKTGSSGFELNVSKFNTSNVKSMHQMFKGCAVTYLDLSSFDTHQVTDMTGMFDSGQFEEIVFSQKYVSSLSTLCDLAFWKDTDKLKTVTYTGDIPESIHNDFYHHVGTESNPALLKVPEEYWEHYRAKFDGQKFYGGYFTLGDEDDPDNPSHHGSQASAYVVYNEGTLTFYYDNQRSGRQGTTYGLNDVVGDNCPSWNRHYDTTTKVVFDASFSEARPKTTYRWFSNFWKITEIQGMEYLNTSEVTNMGHMFYYVCNLASLDVSGFDTGNVTNMNSMFFLCKGVTDLDVSGFDTGKVTDMVNMFSNCSSLTKLDVSKFNTENVINMGGMFAGCKGINYLNVSNFDTRNVTLMSQMFFGCSSLTSLDVSKFNTSNVTGMSSMFKKCTELTNLIMGSQFTSDESTNMDALFANCSKLCKVTFIGDIPTSINSKFFNGVGTAVAPATLVVPEQYEANFQAKFDGNMFYGGYFTLAGVEFKKGDLNFDGEVSDDDLEKMVRLIILGMYEANADLNGDGVVNVADIVELVKIINSDNGTGSGYFWMGNYMPKSNTFPTINGKEVEGIVTTYTSLDDAMAKASRAYSAGEYAIVMYPSNWGVKDDLVFLDSANKKYYATKQKNLPDFPDYLYYESTDKIGANTTMTLSTEVVAKAAGATLSSK